MNSNHFSSRFCFSC